MRNSLLDGDIREYTFLISLSTIYWFRICWNVQLIQIHNSLWMDDNRWGFDSHNKKIFNWNNGCCEERESFHFCTYKIVCGLFFFRVVDDKSSECNEVGSDRWVKDGNGGFRTQLVFLCGLDLYGLPNWRFVQCWNECINW